MIFDSFLSFSIFDSSCHVILRPLSEIDPSGGASQLNLFL